MDFSDNEIKKLENFPRYKRLSSLLFCNNHISKISEELGTSLPNLSCLILTNNKVGMEGGRGGRGRRGQHYCFYWWRWCYDADPGIYVVLASFY